MANIKSAMKRIRVTKRNEKRNKGVKAVLKSQIKKAKALITEKKDGAVALVRTAIKKLDKAASKGILHKKTVARKKSRLMKLLNKSK